MSETIEVESITPHQLIIMANFLSSDDDGIFRI